MSLTSGGFVLEAGDTHPNDFEYGREFVAIVHGKPLKRKYNVIYCEACSNQILAKYMPAIKKDLYKYPVGSQYRLQGGSAFNQTINCSDACRFVRLKTINQGNINSSKIKKPKPFSKQVPPWTAAQIRSVNAFISDPASKILRG